MSQTICSKFADFACNPPELPGRVVHAADRALLDTIGAMVAGGVHETTQTLQYALNFPSGTSSTVLGIKTDAETAAYVNGVSAHVWDIDDTSYTGLMHGSAVILPAVLGIAQEIGSDTDTIMRAYITGSEITYALGEMCSYSHYYLGWWSTATLSLAGATAAVSVLLNLDRDQAVSAIGLAAAASGASRSIFGTDGKPLLVGDMARRAITFARLAKSGLSGPDDAFEHSCGFIELLNDGEFDSKHLESLGAKWRLVEPGLLFKTSPVCSAAHSGIEKMAELVDELETGIDQISEVRAEVSELVSNCMVFSIPESPQQAQFSLPYALACSALHGRVRFEDLSQEEIGSAEKIEFMAKVSTVPADDLSTPEMRIRNPECTRLFVKLKDGKIATGFCGIAKGMPENPLSDGELIKKFNNSVAFAGREGYFEPKLGCNPAKTFASLTS